MTRLAGGVLEFGWVRLLERDVLEFADLVSDTRIDDLGYAGTPSAVTAISPTEGSASSTGTAPQVAVGSPFETVRFS
ncbi:hypothetical protein [Natrinema salsiterrestre]|uniref:Uncharacterized protein n=1 Tax=Natrinema salsiterrestre TaxID=2950540 RepID=A0A9Q4L3I6_9EURY|nr:hypothetical protein [Natrinema salsiterrestre]MDF9746917.1 hypothetical protein [Natrinema salsiterrestre]